MNQLRGRIVGIESNDHVSLVDVEISGDTFSAMLLETPESAPYLAIGNEVQLMFKETEVSLAKNLSGLISLRNRVQGTVRAVRSGAILSEVELDYRGHKLVSIITTRSIRRLSIREGDEVEALIKANEVSLMEVRSDR